MILLLLKTVKAKFNLQEIHNEAGYMIIKQKSVKLISGYDKIIHIVNIESYLNAIASIRDAIECNHKIFKDDNLHPIMKGSLINCKYKLSTVLPHQEVMF